MGSWAIAIHVTKRKLFYLLGLLSGIAYTAGEWLMSKRLVRGSILILLLITASILPIAAWTYDGDWSLTGPSSSDDWDGGGVDIMADTAPPRFLNVYRNPIYPGPTSTVGIQAAISDEDANLSMVLRYSTDQTNWTNVSMPSGKPVVTYNDRNPTTGTVEAVSLTKTYVLNGTLQYLYVYCYSSDSNTMYVDIEGYNASSDNWERIYYQYSSSPGTGAKVDKTFTGKAYTQWRITYYDYQNDDEIYYNCTYWVAENPYTGQIPAAGSATDVWYYVNATDSSNNTANSPVYNYTIDRSKPVVIDHTVFTGVQRSVVPLLIATNVSDDIYLTSVKLNWSTDNTTWTLTNMTQEDGNETVGEFWGYLAVPTKNVTYYYRIEVWDNGGNHGNSTTSSFVWNPPPTLEGVAFSPARPNNSTSVKVNATVKDADGLSAVWVMYSVDQSTWSRINATASGSNWTATIPAINGSAWVYYRFFANDTDGGISNSSLIKYFIDEKPPEYLRVQRVPDFPGKETKVNVSAIIFDDSHPMSVKVAYGYDNSTWTSLSTTTSGASVTYNDRYPAIGNVRGVTLSRSYQLGGILEYLYVWCYSSDSDTLYVAIDGFNESSGQWESIYFQNSYSPGTGAKVNAWLKDRGFTEWRITYYDYENNDYIYYNCTYLVNEKEYSAIIPAAGSKTKVYYFFNATDAAGNIGKSQVYNYTIDRTAPIVVNHTVFTGVQRSGEPIDVYANVTDDKRVALVQLNWSVDNSTWQLVNMTTVTGNDTSVHVWADLPVPTKNTTFYFRIEADDEGGNHNNTNTSTFVWNPPPTIDGLNSWPANPNNSTAVKVNATVKDADGIAKVWMLYSINQITWTRVNATASGSNYSAQIPAINGSAWVYFQFFANDTDGGINKSSVHRYFIDEKPPAYFKVVRKPDFPGPQTKVNVTAIITDDSPPVAATLKYGYDGTNWTTLSPDIKYSTVTYTDRNPVSGTVNNTLLDVYYDLDGELVYLNLFINTSDNDTLYVYCYGYNESRGYWERIFYESSQTSGSGVKVDQWFVESRYTRFRVRTYDYEYNDEFYYNITYKVAAYRAQIPAAGTNNKVYWYMNATDAANNTATSPVYMYEIDRNAPIIHNFTLPTMWRGTEEYEMYANASDNKRLVSVWMNWSTDNSTWILDEMDQESGNDTTGEFMVELPVPSTNTTYYFRVMAYDEPGNMANTTLQSFYWNPPPWIDNVTYSPLHPNNRTNVTITAKVWDADSVSAMWVMYSTDQTTWTRVNGTLSGGNYSATVPNMVGYKWVYFRVFANDTDGGTNRTEEFNYFIDETVPSISAASRKPDYPGPTTPVFVEARVRDDTLPLSVTVEYGYDASNWTSVNTTLVGATLPEPPSVGVGMRYSYSRYNTGLQWMADALGNYNSGVSTYGTTPRAELWTDVDIILLDGHGSSWYWSQGLTAAQNGKYVIVPRNNWDSIRSSLGNPSYMVFSSSGFNTYWLATGNGVVSFTSNLYNNRYLGYSYYYGYSSSQRALLAEHLKDVYKELESWKGVIPPAGNNTKVYFRYVATDGANNTAYGTIYSYDIDQTAPTIHNHTMPSAVWRGTTPVEIYTNVSDNNRLISAWLNWSTDNSTWNLVEMSKLSGNDTMGQFMEYLPVPSKNTTYYFRILAYDEGSNLGNTTLKSFIWNPPPWIENITTSPLHPNNRTKVTLSATAWDADGVSKVWVRYSKNQVNWTRVNATKSGSIWSISVPATNETEWVSYRIYSNDTDGGTNRTAVLQYFIDQKVPHFSKFARTPDFPGPNTKVNVTAYIQDDSPPVNVTTRYSFDNSTWSNLTTQQVLQNTTYNERNPPAGFTTGTLKRTYKLTGELQYLYVYCYASDSDTMHIDIDGFNSSSAQWEDIFYQHSETPGNGVKVQSYFTGKSYTKWRITYYDYEHNDNIYYSCSYIVSEVGYLSTIPAAGSNTKVYYYYNATDSANNSVNSAVLTYDIDTQGPRVINHTLPLVWRGTTALDFYANISDDNRLDSAWLNWSTDNSTWTLDEMSKLSGNDTFSHYKTTLPYPLPAKNTTYYFRVLAYDEPGNLGNTTLQSFYWNPPPWIENVTFSPLLPNNRTTVTISASVWDTDNVSAMWIFYSTDAATWNKVSGAKSGSFWNATIPAMKGISKVYFRVHANDTGGGKNNTGQFEYVIDESAPVISQVTMIPPIAGPLTNVSVTASVDDINPLTTVYLQYGYDNKTWTSVNMTGSTLSASSKVGGHVRENNNIYFQGLTWMGNLLGNWRNGVSGYGGSPSPLLWTNMDIILLDGCGSSWYYQQAVTAAQAGKYVITNRYTWNSARSTLGNPPYKSFSSNGWTSYGFMAGGGVIAYTTNLYNNNYIGYSYYYGYNPTQRANHAQHMKDAYKEFIGWTGIIPPAGNNTKVYYRVSATDAANNTALTEVFSYIIDRKGPTINNYTFPKKWRDNRPLGMYANVTDNRELVSVWMNWSTDNVTWNLVQMTKISGDTTSGEFRLIFPVPKQNTTYYYQILAYDVPGNVGKTPLKVFWWNPPPWIDNVMWYPPAISNTTKVIISAEVWDADNVSSVWVKYSIDLVTWKRVNSTKSGNIWNATIPAHKGVSWVYFTVYAKAGDGGTNNTDQLKYEIDSKVPKIGKLKWDPLYPGPKTSVTVSTFVDDDSPPLNLSFYYGYNNKTWNTSTQATTVMTKTFNDRNPASGTVIRQTLRKDYPLEGMLLYLYVYCYSSDRDGLTLTIDGFNSDTQAWERIHYSRTNGNGPKFNKHFTDKSYTQFRISYYDSENNDQIYYNITYVVGGNIAFLIPPAGNNSKVYFYLNATDAAGNTATSPVYNYTIDSSKPWILNHTVLGVWRGTDEPEIYANISDDKKIGTVWLNWSDDNSTWNLVEMELESGSDTSGEFGTSIETAVPTKNTTFYFRIIAYDEAGNMNNTTLKTFNWNPPPWIYDISYWPLIPNNRTNITVSATVWDADNVSVAGVSYSTDQTTWKWVKGVQSGGVWKATIPAISGSEWLYLRGTANDTEGGSNRTGIFTIFIDEKAPTFSSVSHTPTLPGPNDPVTVVAAATDKSQPLKVTLYYGFDNKTFKALNTTGGTVEKSYYDRSPTVRGRTLSKTYTLEGVLLYLRVYCYSSDRDGLRLTINGFNSNTQAWERIHYSTTNGNGYKFNQNFNNPYYTQFQISYYDTENNDNIYYSVDYKVLEGAYQTTIPAAGSNTTIVYFYFSATDAANNTGNSSVYFYNVDSIGPTINNFTLLKVWRGTTNLPIYANVTDDWELTSVWLNWSTDNATWTIDQMSKLSGNTTTGQFRAYLPYPNPAKNTTYYYKIMAYDPPSNMGNTTLQMFYWNPPPWIDDLGTTPQYPTNKTTVKITAKAWDDDNVSKVWMTYSKDQTSWTRINATLSGSNWTATMPAINGTSWIYYRIWANDTDTGINRTSNNRYYIDENPPTFPTPVLHPEYPNASSIVTVGSQVADDVGIKNATLMYTMDGGKTWKSVTMKTVSLPADVSVGGWVQQNNYNYYLGLEMMGNLIGKWNDDVSGRGGAPLPYMWTDVKVILLDGCRANWYPTEAIDAAKKGKYVITNRNTWNGARSILGNPSYVTFTSNGFTTYGMMTSGGAIAYTTNLYNNEYIGYSYYYGYNPTRRAEHADHMRDAYTAIMGWRAKIPKTVTSKTVYYKVKAYDLSGLTATSQAYNYTTDAKGPTVTGAQGPPSPAVWDRNRNFPVWIAFTDETFVGGAYVYYTYDNGSSWYYRVLIKASGNDTSGNFTGYIPAPTYNTWVRFYYIVYDRSLNDYRYPTGTTVYRYKASDIPSFGTITHFPNIANGTTVSMITGEVTDIEGVKLVQIIYRSGTSGNWTAVNMTKSGSREWTGRVKSPGQTGTVYYYLHAIDILGLWANSTTRTYKVDADSPTITLSTPVPAYPNTTTDVRVDATIRDPSAASFNVKMQYKYGMTGSIVTFLDNGGGGTYTVRNPTSGYGYRQTLTGTYQAGGGMAIKHISVYCYSSDRDGLRLTVNGFNRDTQAWERLHYSTTNGNGVKFNQYFTDKYYTQFSISYYDTENNDRIWSSLKEDFTRNVAAPGYSTWMYYRMTATDEVGNTNKTEWKRFWADGILPMLESHKTQSYRPAQSNVVLTALFRDESRMDRAYCYFSYAGGPYNRVNMTRSYYNGTYLGGSATIPATSIPLNVTYYFQFYDAANNTNISKVYSYRTKMRDIYEGAWTWYDCSKVESEIGYKAWEWDFDYNGTFEREQNGKRVRYRYLDDGNYTVAVQLRDHANNTTMITFTMTVLDLGPNARISSMGTVYEGDEVTFDGSISSSWPDSIANYDWDFDYDGGNFTLDGSGMKANHTFMANRTYMVALRITDDDGSSDLTAIYVVVLDRSPTVVVTFEKTVNEGQTVWYNATNTTSWPDAIDRFEWDFEYDGTFSDDANGNLTSHVYMDNGRYDFVLRVYDSDGSYSQFIGRVRALDLGPTAVIDCLNEENEGTGLFINGSASRSYPDAIASIEWDFHYDGTFKQEATGLLVNFTYMDDGNYTIALRVTDDDGSYCMTSKDVVIRDLIPTAVLEGPDFTWEGAEILLNASKSTSYPDDIVAFEWDFDYLLNFTTDGTGDIINHTYMDNGSYKIGLAVIDDDGSRVEVFLTIDVGDLGPLANLTATGEMLEGSPMILDGRGSKSYPDEIVLYEWDINYTDGNFTVDYDGTVVEHTYMDNGTYTVAFRIFDDDGTTDEIFYNITISDLGPNAALKTEMDTVAEGTRIIFEAGESTSFPDEIVEYWWDWDGDGTSDNVTKGFTGNHVYTKPGLYKVIMTVVDDDGTTNSANVTVTVRDVAPKAKLETPTTPEGENVTLNATGSTEPGSDFAFFRWDLNSDGEWDAEETEPTLVRVWLKPGIYDITMEVEDEDGSTDQTTTLLSITDVAPIAHAGGPYVVNEGEFFTLSAANSTEPGNNFTAFRWDLEGDGIYDLTGMEVQWIWNRSDLVPVITLEVEDEDGSTDKITFNVTVLDIEPTFDPVMPTDVYEHVSVEFSLENVFDPGTEDFEVHWYFGDGGEAGEMSVSHTYLEQGLYQGYVTVEDNDGTVVRWDWDEPLLVSNSNPVWTLEFTDYNITEDKEFSFFLTAGDTPNDTVSYDFDGPGGKIDPVTGEFKWTPLDEHVGPNSFTFIATDEDGGYSEIIVVLDVEDVDNDFLGMSVAMGIGLILLIIILIVTSAVLVVRQRAMWLWSTDEEEVLTPEDEGVEEAGDEDELEVTAEEGAVLEDVTTEEPAEEELEPEDEPAEEAAEDELDLGEEPVDEEAALEEPEPEVEVAEEEVAEEVSAEAALADEVLAEEEPMGEVPEDSLVEPETTEEVLPEPSGDVPEGDVDEAPGVGPDVEGEAPEVEATREVEEAPKQRKKVLRKKVVRRPPMD
jgi:hypothetical protein